MDANLYVCEAIEDGACTAWREVGWLLLEPAELGQLVGAVLLVFAVAFGFRMIIRLLFP